MIDLENIKRDPIEETERFKALELDVNIRARDKVVEFIQWIYDFHLQDEMAWLLETNYGYDRFCFEKKKILWERYGIEWKSPVDLNPGVDFDRLAAECPEEEEEKPNEEE